MSFKDQITDINRRMDGAVEAVKKDFAGLRTGRASTALLEPVMVDAYGSSMPMTSVGTIGAPEARMLTVQVWDKAMVSAVEKAIRNSGLGLNPSPDGQLIRCPVPPLSEERRQEMTKIAGKYAEQARVAVRNVRRDGMDELKQLEKSGDMSKDEHHAFGEDVQKTTDAHIKQIDDLLTKKEDEIMQV